MWASRKAWLLRRDALGLGGLPGALSGVMAGVFLTCLCDGGPRMGLFELLAG